jgi:hypothetical protein
MARGRTETDKGHYQSMCEQSVPHFIVFSNSEGFDSDSWTVQCGILQHNLLGGGPPDEEPVPELPVGDGTPFAFLALDSRGQGQFINHRNQNRMGNRTWESSNLRTRIRMISQLDKPILGMEHGTLGLSQSSSSKLLLYKT